MIEHLVDSVAVYELKMSVSHYWLKHDLDTLLPVLCLHGAGISLSHAFILNEVPHSLLAVARQ